MLGEPIVSCCRFRIVYDQSSQIRPRTGHKICFVRNGRLAGCVAASLRRAVECEIKRLEEQLSDFSQRSGKITQAIFFCKGMLEAIGFLSTLDDIGRVGCAGGCVFCIWMDDSVYTFSELCLRMHLIVQLVVLAHRTSTIFGIIYLL